MFSSSYNFVIAFFFQMDEHKEHLASARSPLWNMEDLLSQARALLTAPDGRLNRGEREIILSVINYLEDKAHMLEVKASKVAFCERCAFSDSLNESLEMIHSLKQGWLGDGEGQVVDALTFQSAIELLRAVVHAGMLESGITPTPEGGIDFGWGDKEHQLAVATPRLDLYIVFISKLFNSDCSMAATATAKPDSARTLLSTTSGNCS